MAEWWRWGGVNQTLNLSTAETNIEGWRDFLCLSVNESMYIQMYIKHRELVLMIYWLKCCIVTSVYIFFKLSEYIVENVLRSLIQH